MTTNFSSASVRTSVAWEGLLLCVQLAHISVLDYFSSLKLVFRVESVVPRTTEKASGEGKSEVKLHGIDHNEKFGG